MLMYPFEFEGVFLLIYDVNQFLKVKNDDAYNKILLQCHTQCPCLPFRSLVLYVSLF